MPRLADVVVVSVFVNPTQFGAGEDFNRYPRPFEHDLRECESAGVDVVFAPTVTVYPHGASSTFVEVPGLPGPRRCQPPRAFSRCCHGRAETLRTGAPDLAVFGQKDFQQQLVIRRMVEDLHLPVELSIGPTVREADGLAISSRNRYLNPDEPAAGALSVSRRAGTRPPWVNAGPSGFDRFFANR